MAVYMATLANGGTRVTPHLLKAVDDGSWLEAGADAAAAVEGRDRPCRNCRRSATGCGWWSIRRGTGATRSEGRRRQADHDVSGKTGTAQVISNQGRASAAGKTDKNLSDNGWFVFFAPRDNPQIAGVVFLEHGVHGGNAAMVAHHILDTFFAKKDGRPLPPKPTPEAEP